MKVPTIATVRIAILIASFASINFIVVLLFVPGVSCSVRPSQVTLVMQAGYQTPTLGAARPAIRIYRKTSGKAAIPLGWHLIRPGPPGEATQTKTLVGNIYVRCSGRRSQSVRVYSFRHG